MDIDATVKQLMAARRIPLDKIMQKRQTFQWQQDSYREMNSKILDLKNNAFNMKLQGSYLTKKVSTGDETTVTATGTSNATDGIYKLNISQLAESASITSTSSVGASVTAASKINSVDASIGADFKFTIAGEKGTATIEIDNEATIGTFVSSVNSKSTLTGVKVSFDDTMKRFFFVSSNTGVNSKVELNSENANFVNNVLKLSGSSPKIGEQVTGTAEFKSPVPDLTKKIDATLGATVQKLRIGYDGSNYEFSVDKNTTIGGLIDDLNTELKATGIVAGLDSTTGALTFNKPDSNKPITFSDLTSDSKDLVSALGLPTKTPTGTSVKGALFLTMATDTNKVINSSLKADQTFRIAYDVDGNGSKNYDFTISSTTTISSLINKINASDLGTIGGVNAQLDSATGKLILTSPKGDDVLTPAIDEGKHFSFSDQTSDSTNILTSLGLIAGINDPDDLPNTVDSEADPTRLNYTQVSAKGKNVMLKYNEVDVEFASNTFTINGINITAKKATNTDVNLTVYQDVDTVYNSIKSFVDKYNEVLGAVNAEISEERYRAYSPLTDEQKEAMEESQITLWENKAKSGMLRNDSILSNAVSEFRSDWYQSVTGVSSGDYRQLSDVGITTLDYSEKGKLYINESKLKEALAKDPEAVMRLFTSNDGNASSTGGDGVAVRISDAADRVLSKLKTKAGTSSSLLSNYDIGKQMTRLDKEISTWQSRLTDIENQYYKQFTAMETAMNKYNSQSASLAQFAGS